MLKQVKIFHFTYFKMYVMDLHLLQLNEALNVRGKNRILILKNSLNRAETAGRFLKKNLEIIGADLSRLFISSEVFEELRKIITNMSKKPENNVIFFTSFAAFANSVLK